MSSLRHLAARFFGSLSRRPPSPADDAWAISWLIPREQAVWWRMDVADRRHAIGVARRVGSDERPVMAAALLHDCGKVDAALGPFGRSAATVWAAVRGRERAARSEGRFGRYLRHPEIGAAILASAGSDPLTVAWAAEHHLPASSWTVERPVADVLKSADDD